MGIKPFLFFLLGSVLFLSGQDIEFDRMKPKDGLSQRIVYAIIQDRQGFMWLGTRNGLNRFDGNAFVTYTHQRNRSDSLSNNVIRSLCEDRKGNLWIGTWGGGLNRFDPRRNRFTRIGRKDRGRDSLPEDFIFQVYSDHTGLLWIVSQNGLSTYDPRLGRFSRCLINGSNACGRGSGKIYTVAQDSLGTIWAGTESGLARYDRVSKDFSLYKYKNGIRSIAGEKSGKLWVGTEAGEAMVFDPINKRFSPWIRNGRIVDRELSLDSISALGIDGSGNVWIGTFSRGAVFFDRAKNRIQHFQYDPLYESSIGDDRIKSIFFDRTGIVWIGTDSGISRFSPYKRKFAHYKNDPRISRSLCDNRVRAIFADKKEILWVGTESGLTRIDRKNSEYRNHRCRSSDMKDNRAYVVNSIFEDSTAVLWIGTNAGLKQFNRKSENFSGFPRDSGAPNVLNQGGIWAIQEDGKQNLWIGTKEGLVKFDRRKKSFSHYVHDPADPHSLICNFVHTILIDRRGFIWVGTDQGMDAFDPEHSRFSHFQSKNDDPFSLINNNVWSIHEDRQGNLWVGTLGGLNRFNPQKKRFALVEVEPDFSNRSIYGILEDEQETLWISTDNGLFAFNPGTEALRRYDASDGLQDNEFGLACCFQSRRGEMFFGGENGFNSFFPLRIPDNPHVPPVVLTDFRIFDQQKGVEREPVSGRGVSFIRSAVLSHRENFLTFRFAALDFTVPEKNRYAYRMDKVDHGWHESTPENQAVYNNLNPGLYTFRVRGSNNDGIWNTEGLILRLKILPPFWRTWWFQMIAILLILAVLSAFFLQKRRRWQQRALLKEKTSQLILAQKMKLVGLLAAGATHDLGNLLSTIVGYSRRIADRQSLNERESEDIETVKTAAGKAIQIVKQILAFSRPAHPGASHPDLSRLTDEILNILKVIIPGNISLSWKKPVKAHYAAVDPIRFQQVIINLVFNAVEAMPGGGALGIDIATESKRVRITVRDSGPGIDGETLKKIFTPFYTTKSKEKGSGLGLFAVQQIVDEFSGEIRVESKAGTGSKFTLLFSEKDSPKPELD